MSAAKSPVVPKITFSVLFESLVSEVNICEEGMVQSLTWQGYRGHRGGGCRRLGGGLLERGQGLLDVQVAARAQVGLQPELRMQTQSVTHASLKPVCKQLLNTHSFHSHTSQSLSRRQGKGSCHSCKKSKMT